MILGATARALFRLAAAHGIGATLLEEFVYDDEGQLLTTTFMDYLKPTALDVPAFRVAALETPSPRTPLAAIANAVEDALAPLGVTITRLPLTPARIWEAIRRA